MSVSAWWLDLHPWGLAGLSPNKLHGFTSLWTHHLQAGPYRSATAPWSVTSLVGDGPEFLPLEGCDWEGSQGSYGQVLCVLGSSQRCGCDEASFWVDRTINDKSIEQMRGAWHNHSVCGFLKKLQNLSWPQSSKICCSKLP